MTKPSKSPPRKPVAPSQADCAHAPIASSEAVVEATLVAPARTKVQQVVDLLMRPEGASIADLMSLTGWQAHSVRGAMSGAIKKGLGLTITSEKVGDLRIYRVVEPAA